MDVALRGRALLTLLITGAVSLASAQNKKEFRYSVQPGATVAITNDFGPITVRAATANQVLVTTTAHSNKVEVDGNQSGNRLDIRTHFLQKASSDESAVDYDVQVPNNAALVVRTRAGR